MYKRVGCIAFLIFLALHSILKSETFKLFPEGKIRLEEKLNPVLYAAGFIISEDNGILVFDGKDEEHPFKIYDHLGRLIKHWGRIGPGPDEFGAAFPMTYEKPFLAFIDPPNHKIFIYQISLDYDFKKMNEFPWVAFAPGITINNHRLILASFVRSREGKDYSLVLKDFQNKHTEYLLPTYQLYGYSSEGEYNDKHLSEIAPISGAFLFIDSFGDTLFMISQAKLMIIKLNLRTKKLAYFGQETKNYHHPLTWEIKKAYSKAVDLKNGKDLTRLLDELSWISGLFASRDFVGVLYINPDKATGLWRVFLHLYAPEGKFIKEMELVDSFSFERFLYYYFDKNSRLLYIMSKWIDEKESIEKQHINKYRITLAE